MYHHMASCMGENGEGVTHESHVSPPLDYTPPPLGSQVGINSVEQIEKKGKRKGKERKRKEKERKERTRKFFLQPTVLRRTEFSRSRSKVCLRDNSYA